MQLLNFIFQSWDFRALLFDCDGMSRLFIKNFILVSLKFDDFLIDLFSQILDSIEELILLLYRHLFNFARINDPIDDLIKSYFRISFIVLYFFCVKLFFSLCFFCGFLLSFNFFCFFNQLFRKLDLIVCNQNFKVIYRNSRIVFY